MLKSGGVNIASVKQFKGCNKNWSYTYVWEGFRNSHKNVNWWACSGISECTKAYGQLEWGSGGEGWTATDQRC